jgi:hypothetical protein
MFGTKMFGHSDQSSTSSTNTSEIRKYIDLNQSSVLAAQYLITGTGTRYKIVATQLQAREQAALPSSWQAQ